MAGLDELVRKVLLTFFMKENKGLAGELVNIHREAGQTIAAALINFGTHVKKKEKGSNEIVLMAMGRAINKIVMIAELIKPRNYSPCVSYNNYSVQEGAGYNSVSILLVGTGSSLREAAKHTASCHPSISQEMKSPKTVNEGKEKYYLFSESKLL